MMDCLRAESDNTTRIMIGGYDAPTDGEFRVYTAMAPQVHTGTNGMDKLSRNCVKETPNLAACRKASTEIEVGYGPGFVQRLRARFTQTATHDRTPNASNMTHLRHKRFPSAGDVFARAKVFAESPSAQNNTAPRNSEKRCPTSDLTASPPFTQSLSSSQTLAGSIRSSSAYSKNQMQLEAKNFSTLIACGFTLPDENVDLSADSRPDMHKVPSIPADAIQSIRPPAEVKNISARVAEYRQNSAPRPWKAASVELAEATSAAPRFSALREKFEQISRTSVVPDTSSYPRKWARSRSTHFDDVPAVDSTYNGEATEKFTQSLKRRSRSTTDYCTPAYSPPADPKPGRLMKASFAYVVDDSTVSADDQRRPGDSSPPPDEPLPTSRTVESYSAEEAKPKMEINPPKIEAIRLGVSETTVLSTVTRPYDMADAEEKTIEKAGTEKGIVNGSLSARKKAPTTPTAAEYAGLSEVRHFLDRFNDQRRRRESANLSPPPRKFSSAAAPDYRTHLRARCQSTESKSLPNEMTKMSSATEPNDQRATVSVDSTVAVVNSETSSVLPSYSTANTVVEKLGDSVDNTLFNRNRTRSNDASIDDLRTSLHYSLPIADHTTVNTEEMMKMEAVETVVRALIPAQKNDKPRNSFSSAYFDREQQSATEDHMVATVKVFQTDNCAVDDGIRNSEAAAEANSFERKEQKCPTNEMVERKKDVNCAAAIIKTYNSLYTVAKAVDRSADFYEVSSEAQIEQKDFKEANEINKKESAESENVVDITENTEETMTVAACDVQEIISQTINELVHDESEESSEENQADSESHIQPQFQGIRLNGSNDYDLIVDFEVGGDSFKIDSDCNNNNLVAGCGAYKQRSSSVSPIETEMNEHNAKYFENLAANPITTGNVDDEAESFENYDKLAEETDERGKANSIHSEDDNDSIKEEINEEPTPTKEEEAVPLTDVKMAEDGERFVVELGLVQVNEIEEIRETEEDDESNEDEDWNAADNPFAAALADARNFAHDGEACLFDDVDFDRAASPPSDAPHVVAEKFSLLASDGGPVRHSLLSLVMDEDIPHLLEAMAEEYNFTFEDYWTMSVSTSSIIVKRVDDGSADRKRKSQTRISFEEAPPRVFAYLDEASAVAEQESSWPDARTISFDEYQQIAQRAEDALVQQQMELAAWQSQMHTSSCNGASTSDTISNVLSESISRMSMTSASVPQFMSSFASEIFAIFSPTFLIKCSFIYLSVYDFLRQS